jgi:hypothetical protein
MRTRTNALVLGLVLITAAGAAVMAARPRQEAKPEDVIIVGRVVDLYSYMSGQASSDDPTKDIRDNLRSGVPAALETDDALVVIGMGKQNPARKLLPLANKEVELTGKLYDKDGLLYVDMQEIKSLEEAERGAEQPGEHPVQPPPDDGQ